MGSSVVNGAAPEIVGDGVNSLTCVNRIISTNGALSNSSLDSLGAWDTTRSPSRSTVGQRQSNAHSLDSRGCERRLEPSGDDDTEDDDDDDDDDCEDDSAEEEGEGLDCTTKVAHMPGNNGSVSTNPQKNEDNSIQEELSSTEASAEPNNVGRPEINIEDVSNQKTPKSSASQSTTNAPTLVPPFESIKVKLKRNSMPPNAQLIQSHIDSLISQNEAIIDNWNLVSIRSYNSSASSSLSTNKEPGSVLANKKTSYSPGNEASLQHKQLQYHHKVQASPSTTTSSASALRRPSKRWSITAMGNVHTVGNHHHLLPPHIAAAGSPSRLDHPAFSPSSNPNQLVPCDTATAPTTSFRHSVAAMPLSSTASMSPLNFQLDQLDRHRSHQSILMGKNSSVSPEGNLTPDSPASRFSSSSQVHGLDQQQSRQNQASSNFLLGQAEMMAMSQQASNFPLDSVTRTALGPSEPQQQPVLQHRQQPVSQRRYSSQLSIDPLMLENAIQNLSLKKMELHNVNNSQSDNPGDGATQSRSQSQNDSSSKGFGDSTASTAAANLELINHFHSQLQSQHQIQLQQQHQLLQRHLFYNAGADGEEILHFGANQAAAINGLTFTSAPTTNFNLDQSLNLMLIQHQQQERQKQIQQQQLKLQQDQQQQQRQCDDQILMAILMERQRQSQLASEQQQQQQQQALQVSESHLQRRKSPMTLMTPNNHHIPCSGAATAAGLATNTIGDDPGAGALAIVTPQLAVGSSFGGPDSSCKSHESLPFKKRKISEPIMKY